MIKTRPQIVDEITKILGAPKSKKRRCITLTGAPESGKSWIIDQVQTVLLSRGVTNLIIIDDAHNIKIETDRATNDHTLQRLAQEDTAPVIVAGETLPKELVSYLKNTALTHYSIEPLNSEESRELLTEIGLQPWTLRAHQTIKKSDGLPGRLLDNGLDFSPLEIDYAPESEYKQAAKSWSKLAAKRLTYSLADNQASLEELYAQHRDSNDADALALIADSYLLEDEFELAIQHAERAVVKADDEPHIKLWASAIAASARARRGENLALISLHQLAGAASKQNNLILESAILQILAQTAIIQGDVASGRRAATKSAYLADQAGMLSLATCARFLLTDAYLASDNDADTQAASAYLDELSYVAKECEWTRLSIAADISRARALLQTGHAAIAAEAADQTLTQVLAYDPPSFASIEAAVIAARAYAATEAYPMAQAMLDRYEQEIAADRKANAVRSKEKRQDPAYWVVLERIRLLGHDLNQLDLNALKAAQKQLNAWADDGDGGALKAAHTEAAAWIEFAAGAPKKAANLLAEARALWQSAECHDELALTDNLVLATAEYTKAPEDNDPESFSVLTKREREIARLIAAGMTNVEIAEKLFLSRRTAEHHAANILRKLELPNRRSLVLGKVS